MRLVDFGPAGNVVRLDCQHFLQGVGRAVSFQSPDFHFPETLTTELRFTAQRLLRDKAVRPGGTRVDFVVHKVVQFQQVLDADCDRAANCSPVRPSNSTD